MPGTGRLLASRFGSHRQAAEGLAEIIGEPDPPVGQMPSADLAPLLTRIRRTVVDHVHGLEDVQAAADHLVAVDYVPAQFVLGHDAMVAHVEHNLYDMLLLDDVYPAVPVAFLLVLVPIVVKGHERV